MGRIQKGFNLNRNIEESTKHKLQLKWIYLPTNMLELKLNHNSEFFKALS